MKYIYKFFSVFLSFILILTAFGLFGVGDSFEVNAGNLLNINTISVGDHIYMGKRDAEGYTGLPYWRVLHVDKSGKTALVISEYLWEGNGENAHNLVVFSDSKNNTWTGSNAQTWCRGFYDNVLCGSRYIAKAEKNDSGYTSALDFEYGESALNDYVFFLSAEEAENMFADDADRTAYIHDGKTKYSGDHWLLRSPYTWKPYYIGMVYRAGYVTYTNVREGYYVRPAFKLDLSKGIPASKDSNGDWIINLDNESEEDQTSFVIKGKTFTHNLDYYAENLSTSQFDNTLCSLMAAISFSAGSRNDLITMYRELGFNDDEYDLSPYDTYESNNNAIREGITYSFGKKTNYKGKTIVLVDIKGTEGLSDILHDISVTGFNNNYSYHQGFKLAADEIQQSLISYLGEEPEYDANTKFFITGHSLGAAAGNILTKQLSTLVGKDSVFNYNFACPNTVTSTQSAIDNPSVFNPSDSCSNMFNICRATDQVAYLPGLGSSMLLEAKEYVQYGWDIFQCFHTKHDYYWGKWGITKWFNDEILGISSAHDMGNYFSYVSKNSPQYSSTNTYGDYFTKGMNNAFVFCPVDATVVDYNGNTIAAIKNNKPVYYNNSFGKVVISTVGDLKCVSYSKDCEYKIRLAATDVGEMNYIVAKGNPDDAACGESKIYKNISLTDSKRMLGIIDNKSIDESSLHVLGNKDSISSDIQEDGSETPHTHVWNTEYTVDKQATCSIDGYKSYHCKICDAVDKSSSVVIPKTGKHVYGAWKTTRAATELAAGQQSHKCSVCGKTETKVIAQLAPTLPKVSISKPKAAKKAATIKWKKVSKKNLKKIKKIQIQYSMDRSFNTGVKTASVSAKKTSKKIKIPKGKVYYIRIRGLNGSHASAWSSVKIVKAK